MIVKVTDKYGEEIDAAVPLTAEFFWPSSWVSCRVTRTNISINIPL
jgi:hypothetical protein